MNYDNLLVSDYFKIHNLYCDKYGKNTLILMQVGSFFEVYATENKGPNINELGKNLNISFTRKNKSKTVSDNNTYMFGFPLLSLDKWLNTIIGSNYNTVIIEQVQKNPIRRKITNIYTPGTFIPSDYKYNEKNQCNFTVINFQLSLKGIIIGLSSYNIITGKGIVYENYTDDNDNLKSLDEISNIIDSYPAKQYLIHFNDTTDGKYYNNMSKEKIIDYLGLNNNIIITNIDNIPNRINQIKLLAETFNMTPDNNIFNNFDFTMKHDAICALCIFIEYIKIQQPLLISKLQKPELLIPDKYLYYGNKPIEQLDIISYNNNNKSLFNIIDYTATSMGKRNLKNQICLPLTDVDELKKRYNHIKYIMNKSDENYKILSKVSDLSKILKKMCLKKIIPSELSNFYNSMHHILEIKENKIININKLKKDINIIISFIDDNFNIDLLSKLSFYNYVEETKDYFNGKYNDITNLVNIINNGSKYMKELSKILISYLPESKYKSLTIKSNDRDGTYLVITSKRCEIIKNKLKNKKIKLLDKTITLKDLEFKNVSNKKNSNIKISLPIIKKINSKVEISKNILANKTKKYFYVNIDNILNYNDNILNIISNIEYFDFINSGALLAIKKGYCKPKIKKDNVSYFKSKELRHPIVEYINDTIEYKPHDIGLGKKKNGIILYGINGSGKSTLMKSIGINIILAQIGYYVAAKKFTYSPYKSIFTRIRGNDNLFKKQSSFYVEMTELKAIMKRNNMNTLVLADEVCRGTEEKSANIIVASIINKLCENKATFITATHLHSIINLPTIKKLNSILIKHISVDYMNNNLIFSRKLLDGPGENYYGLKVAKFLLDDTEFNNMTSIVEKEYIENIENIKLNQNNRYNKMIIDKCYICSKKKNLEIHHIHWQKDCNKYYVISKPHIQKNAEYNTVCLCNKCHDMVDNNTINITGYNDTIKGKILNIINSG